MKAEQRSLERDLAEIYTSMDSNHSLLELLSNNQITIKETLENQDTGRAVYEAD